MKATVWKTVRGREADDGGQGLRKADSMESGDVMSVLIYWTEAEMRAGCLGD